jgi:hypothetical protein
MNPVSKEGPPFNVLMTAKDNIALDPLSGTIDVGPRVKIRRLKGENDG